MRHRGITLVEMAVVIPLGSALLGILVVLLHSVFHYQTMVAREDRCRATYIRLATCLRADARAAERAAPLPDAQAGCEFLAAGRRVQYRLQSDALQRNQYQGDRLTQRDVFPLPPGGQGSFVLPKAREDMLQLRVSVDVDSRTALVPLPWCIEAAVGRRPPHTEEVTP